MGMTTEDAIHDTEVMKEYLEYRGEPRSEGLGVVINIAHKYQKIEQIISDGYLQGKTSGEMLLDIKGVLEDGNNTD